MRKPTRSALAISLVALLLGLMLTVQISSLSNKSSTVSGQDYLTTLTQANEQQQENALLNKQIAQINTELASYQSAGGNVKERQAALLKDKAAAQQAAGITPMTGPGITIQLTADPSLPDYNTNIQNFDPQFVLGYLVNLLYSQGAKGISIQGAAGDQQRLVTTSAIRDISQPLDGNYAYWSVEVNGVDLPAPYTVRAVGNISNMQAILLSEAFAQELKANFGMDCTVTPSQKITLAGYTGVLPGQYAKEVNAK